jgi:hypothetical protein
MRLTLKIRQSMFSTYYFTISQQNFFKMTYYKPTEIGCENQWFFINKYYTRIKRNYPNIRKTFKELKFIHDH